MISENIGFSLISEIWVALMQVERPDADYDDLREKIKSCLSKFNKTVSNAAISKSDSNHIIFAVVAFVDEFLCKKDWLGQTQWRGSPLQIELFDEHRAGEIFFLKFEQLIAEEKFEIAVVYYFCLCLGFRGKWAVSIPENQFRMVQQLRDKFLFKEIQESTNKKVSAFKGVFLALMGLNLILILVYGYLWVKYEAIVREVKQFL